MTDASNMVMGMVLEQGKDDGHRPLAFFSKKLMAVEQNYSTFDRERLAVHKAISHFHHMIEGWQFVIQLDQQPLKCAFI